MGDCFRLPIVFGRGMRRPARATMRSQEIKRRMRTSVTWVAEIRVLVAIGVLMACSSKYSAANNGLVVVPTQGSAVMQTFNLDLANGHLSQINNVNGPPTNGVPTSVVLDPAGAFAYMIVSANPAVTNSATGIQTFQ